MNIEELQDDPDWNAYEFNRKKAEFWRNKVSHEDLPGKEQMKAENKYIEYTNKASEAIRRLNAKMEEAHGPLPPLDMQDFQTVRNQLAEQGHELTIEEIQELLTCLE